MGCVLIYSRVPDSSRPLSSNSLGSTLPVMPQRGLGTVALYASYCGELYSQQQPPLWMEIIKLYIVVSYIVNGKLLPLRMEWSSNMSIFLVTVEAVLTVSSI